MTDTSVDTGEGASRRVGRAARAADDNRGPDAALAEVRETLTAKEREADTLRGQVQSETQRANDAAATALEALTRQMTDRETFLTTAIEREGRAIEGAQAAWKAAKESGDIVAEGAAITALGKAQGNLKVAEIDKANFDAEKPRILAEAKEAAKPREAPKGPTQEAQQWMRDHPRIKTDKHYSEEARIAQKRAAEDLGYAYGSSDSLRYVSSALERMFGKDHGKEAEADGDRTNGRSDSGGISTAAAPGRGEGGSVAGPGNLKLSYGNDGKPQINGNIPAEWREAAGFCGMSPVEYAISMLEHEKEVKEGRAVYSQNSGGMSWRV